LENTRSTSTSCCFLDMCSFVCERGFTILLIRKIRTIHSFPILQRLPGHFRSSLLSNQNVDKLSQVTLFLKKRVMTRDIPKLLPVPLLSDRKKTAQKTIFRQRSDRQKIFRRVCAENAFSLTRLKTVKKNFENVFFSTFFFICPSLLIAFC
jgi:hypothetical protein